jgi:hypothetical protein
VEVEPPGPRSECGFWWRTIPSAGIGRRKLALDDVTASAEASESITGH